MRRGDRAWVSVFAPPPEGGRSQAPRWGPLSMAGQGGWPRRLLSSPLEGGRSGGGLTQGFGVLEGDPPDPAYPRIVCVRQHPAGLAGRRDAGAPRGGTPPPPDPPPLKGGGEKTAAARACPAMAMSASRRKFSRCDRPERRGASPKGRATRAAATFRGEAGDSPPSPAGDRAAAPERAVRRGNGPAGRCRVLRAASVRDRRRRAETGRRISRPDILPCIRGGPFRRAA